jgi:steroid delta-isomerase-like uncharacterized protein
VDEKCRLQSFGLNFKGGENPMTAQSVIAEQSVIDAAKAPIIAYNNKDWAAAKAAIAPDAIYDEVATHRRLQGIEDILEVWRGWATAFPDSKATFHSELVSNGTAVIEVTWRGTHSGPLKTPDGEIAATGKKIELRSCQVIEVADGKAKVMRQYFDMATLLQQLGVTR